MEWMLDIQLGRRNLSPIHRIAITEKYRTIYEKQARENQLSGLKQNQNETVLPNSVKREYVSVNLPKRFRYAHNALPRNRTQYFQIPSCIILYRVVKYSSKIFTRRNVYGSD